MPAKLLAVARRPDGLRDKQHIDQNIPTLKLYYLTSGRQRLYQTSTKYDQTQKCHTLTIRVDSAPGFVALSNYETLRMHGIQLSFGAIKNKNQNPVAERAIQELALECLHISPEGGPLSNVTLALATSNMNGRLRKGGISS